MYRSTLILVIAVLTAATHGQQIGSQSNLIPNGSITIDGDVADWAAVPSFGQDVMNDGAGGYDISQLFIAHDADNFYVRVQLFSDEINFAGTAAGLWTPIDTDKNASTGLGIFAAGIGAEWNGSGVSQFNGWNAAGGHTGSILGPGGVLGARDADYLEYEYAIPRTVFGSDSFFIAVQSEFGAGDLFPNDAGGYFEYHADPVVAPPKPYRYETDTAIANPPAAGGVLGDTTATKLLDGIATDANWLTGGQFVGSQDPAFVPANLEGDNELPQPRVEFSFPTSRQLQSVDITYMVEDEAKIYAPDAVTVSFSNAGSAFGGDVATLDFDDSDDNATDPVGIGAIRTLNVPLNGVTADKVRLDFFNDFEWTALGEIKFNSAVFGDINGNGSLDSGDIDAIQLAIAGASTDVKYDFNKSGSVNYDDARFWVNDLAKTWIGDANVDGEFNSSDFVLVFTAGKFEKDEDATWSQGDWTGDKRFNSSDFVAAFTQGGYEVGVKPATAAVPESSDLGLFGMSLIAVGFVRRRV